MHIFGGGPKPKGSASGPGPGGAKSSLLTVGEREFEQEVLLAESPVLVVFASDRSQACVAAMAEVEAFAKEVEGKLKIVKVDIDKAQMLARQLRLQSVPTFMLFVDQRLGDAQVGPLSRKQLHAMVEPFMPRSQGLLKARELAELIKQNVVVPVDIRDAAAFGRAHLPGARNIPEEELESRLAELFMLPGQPVLYDRTGEKSKALSEKMAAQDTPMAFLEGGILAWESEGLAVERP